MTVVARLVDELTTLLYEVVKRWQLQDGRVCEIVACGACRKKADKPESVVHDSDCPVYRLIGAEEANTAVIRANAEEIADLEDKRDDLEAQVNALTAQMECRNELTARIRALEKERDALRGRAERDAEIARLVEAGDAMDAALTTSATVIRDACKGVVTVEQLRAYQDKAGASMGEWRAALEARGGPASDGVHS